MATQKNFFTKLGELIDQHRAEQLTASQSGTARPHPALRLLRWFVPNGGTLLIVAVLILTQRVWAQDGFTPTSAPGPSATTVNYQGRLANSDGAPITGNPGMTFAIYDAVTAGNLIWGPESHAAVPVSSGLFSVGLGSQTGGGIPPTVWNGDRYLEITVGGETLSPRELIRSVPVAGMALTVPDGSVTTAKLRPDTGQAGIQSNVQVTMPAQPWTRVDVPQTKTVLSVANTTRLLVWFSVTGYGADTPHTLDIIFQVNGVDHFVSATDIGPGNTVFNIAGTTMLDVPTGRHELKLQMQSGLGNEAIVLMGGRVSMMYLAVSP